MITQAANLNHMDLKSVIDANPELSIDGWRYNSPNPNSPYYPEQFPTRRAMLLLPRYLEQIQTSCEYLRHFEIDKRSNSYGLKHQIEQWGLSVGLASYVTNGCAIAAGLLSRYAAVRERNSPNCRFKRL